MRDHNWRPFLKASACREENGEIRLDRQCGEGLLTDAHAAVESQSARVNDFVIVRCKACYLQSSLIRLVYKSIVLVFEEFVMSDSLYVGFVFPSADEDGIQCPFVVGSLDSVHEEIAREVDSLNDEVECKWAGDEYWPVDQAQANEYGFFSWGRVYEVTLNNLQTLSEFG